MVEIKTLLTNASVAKRKLRVEHTVINPDKNIVLTLSKAIQLSKNSTEIPNDQSLVIINPALWSPDSPSFYSVYTHIYDAKTNELLDEVFQPLGIR